MPQWHAWRCDGSLIPNGSLVQNDSRDTFNHFYMAIQDEASKKHQLIEIKLSRCRSVFCVRRNLLSKSVNINYMISKFMNFRCCWHKIKKQGLA